MVIRKNSFPRTVVKPWHTLLRAVMESPFLEGFNAHVDVALGLVVDFAVLVEMVGFNGLGGLFQP